MNFLSSTPLLANNEFILLFWASIGGILVFTGLIIEKIADWMNDRYESPPFKPHKKLELVGWSILMVGIFIEVSDAGWSANDAWQIRQTAIGNSPLNQPVSDVFAVVTIKLSGTNFTEWPLYGSSWIAQMWLCESNILGSTVALNDFQLLSADAGDIKRIDYTSELIQPRESDHGYILRFHPNVDLVPFIPVIRNTPYKANRITKYVKVLKIDTKFIPHDAKLLGGTVELHVNDNIRMDFDVLPQGAYPSPFGMGTNITINDSGFTFIATNAMVTMLPAWDK